MSYIRKHNKIPVIIGFIILIGIVLITAVFAVNVPTTIPTVDQATYLDLPPIMTP